MLHFRCTSVKKKKAQIIQVNTWNYKQRSNLIQRIKKKNNSWRRQEWRTVQSLKQRVTDGYIKLKRKRINDGQVIVEIT